jgi:molecular chaperone DnaK
MSDGFDLGTAQTKVAYVDATGKACSVHNARGEERTPSVIHVSESETVLVGNDAVEQGYLEPERCAKGFKLLLGTTDSLFKSGPLVTATDAAAAVIAQVKQDVERATGRACTQCVATCPANFRDDQKDALIEAYRRNVIEVLRLIPEPTAAAIAYRATSSRDNATILVFDFGGGTFDVSVVRAEGPQLTVLATDGVPKLGGNDIDNCIRKRVLDEVEAQLGRRPTRETDPLFFQDLDVRVTAAKISLNSREKVAIVSSIDGHQIVTEIERSQFHADIEPLLRQALDTMDSAVNAAGLNYDQITQLIMVGGSSRLVRAQEMVADHTGLVPKTDIDPEKAIAYGAALAAIDEMAKKGETAEFRGQKIPSPNLFIQDVTAHGVGCCTVDTSKPDRPMINSVIIPQNTPIPCRKVDRFHLEKDDQSEAKIEILQGKDDALRDDCLIIGELELKGLPPEDKATARIQVEYTIDTNGMVTATATDLVGGSTQTVSVDYKKGITPKSGPAAA